jgi:hypothetical protein
MNLWRRAFVALAIAWVGLLPVAAFAASRPPSVSSGVRDALAFAVYRIGGLICHQRPERSFHLFAVALPVCARCTGIYAGAALLVMAITARGALFPSGDRRPSFMAALVQRRARAGAPADGVRRANRTNVGPGVGDARRVLFLSALPTAATLVYEWSTGQMPSHWLRALSGAPLGAVVAWIVCTVAPARSEVM